MDTEGLKILLALEPKWTVSLNGLEFLALARRTYRLRTPRFNLGNTPARSSNWNGFGLTSFGYTVGQSSGARPIRSCFIRVIACPPQRIFEGSDGHFKSKSAELSACTSEPGKFKDRRCIPIGNTESVALIQGSLWEGTP